MGHSVQKIFGLLCQLKITQCFVECRKHHYEETGDIVDHLRQGWLCSAGTKKVVEAVWSKINQNPCCKQKIITVEMNGHQGLFCAYFAMT